jgi:uncharacterized protein YxeA
MKKFLILAFLCFLAPTVFSQYYQSTDIYGEDTYYQPINYQSKSYYQSTDLYQQQHNRLLQQGYEYYGTVSTYTYSGNNFVNLGAMKIYFKTLGKSTKIIASDGSSTYSVYTNSHFQNPRSIYAGFEYIIEANGTRRYFNP